MNSKQESNSRRFLLPSEGKVIGFAFLGFLLFVAYFFMTAFWQSLIVIFFFLAMIALVIQSRLNKLQSEEQTVSREKLKRDAEYTRKKTKEREFILASKIKELEDSKTSMLKIVHDLQIAKSHFEQEKSKDEAMLSSLGEGLVVTDEKGRIQLVNRVFEELLEWNISEVVGRDVLDIIPSVSEAGKKTSFKDELLPRVLKQGERFTSDPLSPIYYIKKTKSVFPAAVTITPIIIKDKIIGAVEVFRDITREREIDRAKSEFVSLASHQLRTPLSTVNWYTEMLLDGDAGKLQLEQKQYMEEIYNANRRMVGLVNAFLDVSRIEFGTFSIEPEPLQIVKIAQSILNEMKPEIQRKRVEISTNFDDKLPEIMADPKLVSIIIQNLLSNSIKYTPVGGKIEIEISFNKQSLVLRGNQSKSFIRIKVSDNGYGIPNEEQTKIFSKLYRANNVKERDTEGTGLGLYIVKSILDRVGGMVWFESKENQGTTFYVAMPAVMVAKKGTRKLV